MGALCRLNRLRLGKRYDSWMRGTLVAIATAAIAATACSGITAATKTSTVTATVISTVVAAPSTTEPPTPSGPKTTIATDGTFIVGTDIAPGTYKTAGPTAGMSFCSWSRLRDLKNNGLDSTIANGNEPGQGFVTIEPTDMAFYSQYCQPWQKIG